MSYLILKRLLLYFLTIALVFQPLVGTGLFFTGINLVSAETISPTKFAFKGADDSISPDGLSTTIVGLGSTIADVGRSSGKYYFEVVVTSGSATLIGVSDSPSSSSVNRLYYMNNGNKYLNLASATPYGASYTIGDIVGVAVDKDTNSIEFFKNGVSQGVAYSDLSILTTTYPVIVSGSSSGSRSVTANFGTSPFSFAPPDGYLSWDGSEPTVDTSPPAEVTSLDGDHYGSYTNLTWTNPTDSDFRKVRVYRDNVLLTETTSTSYLEYGLIPGTTYVYKVTSVDWSGNESVGAISTEAITSRSRDLVPTMTSNTAPAPFVISASSEFSGSYVGAKAFDDLSNTSGWVTPTGTLTGTLRVDFGTPTPVSSYSLRSRNHTVRGDPKNWSFQASDNGSTWVTLHTVLDETVFNQDELRVYDFYNQTPYRYYRINVTAINSIGGGSYVSIGEMELFYDLNNNNVPSADVSSLKEAHGADLAVLTWAPPVDSEYVKSKVYRDGSYIGETSSALYKDTNLVSGTTYSYKVTTVDFYGNESAGVTISATPTLSTPTTSRMFDGSDDYVTLTPTLASFTDGGSYTTSIWIKPTNTARKQSIFEYVGLNPTNEMGFRVFVDGGKVKSQQLDSLGVIVNEVESPTLTSYMWYHITVTYDSSTKTQRLYVNGSEVDSSVGTSTWAIPAEAYLAKSFNTSSENFLGYLSHATVWNRALNDYEVLDYLETPPTGSESGLVAYWDLADGQSSSTINDVSPNNYDLSVNGVNDSTPPSEVTSITSTKTDLFATLSWTNPLDVDFLRTKVYRDGVYRGETFGTSFSDYGLKSNTTYVYTLKTVDTSDNESSGASYSLTSEVDYDLSFNGASQVAYVNQVIPLGAKSIRFRVKSTSSATMTLIGNAASSAQHGTFIQLVSGKIRVSNFGAANRIILNGTSTINDGRWHDILFTWDGTTSVGSAKLYVDDMSAPNVVANPSSLETTASSNNLHYGRTPGTSTGYLTGEIDNVEIWNRAISPEEASRLSTQLTGTESGLVDYYAFNETAGTVVNDYVGSYDGTVTNATFALSDLIAPAEISGLSETHSDKTIDFRWTNPIDYDFQVVRVYRDAVLILETSDTGFVDSDLTPGTTYNYTFRTMDNVGNESAGFTRPISLPAIGYYTSDATPNMTSNFDPIPYTISFSTETATTGTALKAFDGNVDGTNFWKPTITSGFLTYNFGSGSRKVIRAYSVRVPSLTNTFDQSGMPYSWTLYGSNDNSSWTTLDTRSAQLSWGSSEKRFYETSNLNPYQYYKIHFGVGRNSVSPLISEIEFYEKTSVVDSVPPSEITSLTEEHSGDYVRLRWINPVDSDFKEAKVYRDGVLLGSTTNSTFYDSSLNPNTAYVYKVSAVDSNGNETEGVSTTATTTSYASKVSVPLTSATTPSPYATTASSESGTVNAGWKAFDGLPSTYWNTSNTTSGSLSYDFGLGNGKVVTGYTITSSNDYDQTYQPKNWTLQGSNNNSTWTTLDTQTNQLDWGPLQSRYYTFSNATSYRYYKIVVSAINAYAPSGSVLRVAEIGLFGIPDTVSPSDMPVSEAHSENTTTLSWALPSDTDFSHVNIYRDGILIGSALGTTYVDSNLTPNTTYSYKTTFVDFTGNESAGTITSVTTSATSYYTSDVTPSMTSNTAPSPYSVVPSSQYSASTYGWKAFDGVTNTIGNYWRSTATSGTIAYDFGSNSKKVIRAYSLRVSDEYLNQNRPSSWRLEGSNNGISWTILDTQTSQTNFVPYEKRFYEISNLDPYQHYRINVLSTGITSYFMISEIEFYEKVSTPDSTPASEVISVVSESSDTTTHLSWVNPTDSDFEYVNVYRDSVLVDSTTKGLFTDYGLEPGTSYAYVLKTVDYNGNESAGVPVTSSTITLPPKVSVPLTSNTAPIPYGAAASTETSTTYAAWKAFDSSSTTYWQSTTSPATLTYDFGLGNGKIVTSYMLTARDTYVPTSQYKSWTFAGSNNNSTWTTLDTRTNQSLWGASEKRFFSFTNATSYRYYRLSPTGFYTNSMDLAELELFGIPDTTPPGEVVGLTSAYSDTTATVQWSLPVDTDLAKIKVYRDGDLVLDGTPSDRSYVDANLTSNTSYIYKVVTEDYTGNISEGLQLTVTTSTASSYSSDVTPPLTSNTAPAPYGASASTVNTSYLAWKAFDGNISLDNYWMANASPAQLQYDFGVGYKKVIRAYSIRSANTIALANQPKNWTFRGSNNGTSWTTLDTQLNITNWDLGEKRVFEFANNTAYQLYQLNITANYGGTVATTILEVEMFDRTSTIDTTPSSEVSGLASRYSDTTATLTWTNPTESQMKSVKVYRDGVFVAEVTTSSYTDLNLTPGTAYSYKVATVDINGNESSGIVANVTTVIPPSLLTSNMTSNTAPVPNAITASTTSGTFHPYKAFDQDSTTNSYWSATSPNAWITYDYGLDLGRTITAYSIESRDVFGQTGQPEDWVLEGSNNGSLWTTLHTQSNQMGWGISERRYYTIPNTTSYRYYRLTTTSTQNSTAVQITELRLYGTPDTTPASDISSLSETHTPTAVTLTWTNPPEGDFRKSKVYRDSVYIGETYSNTYVDSALFPSTSYTYKVVTVDSSENLSEGVSLSVTTGSSSLSVLRFDGSNDYVAFSDKVIPVGAKSIRFRIKTTSAAPYLTILSNGHLTNVHGMNVRIESGKIRVYSQKGNGSRYNFLGTKVVNDGQWHDVLLTWDGTTASNAVKLYVDDMSTPDAQVTANSADTTATYNLRLGSIDVGGYYFAGDLDNVELWNRALTPTEAIDYTNNIVGDEPGLVSYFKFNEGADVTVHNYSKTLYGTLTNGTLFAPEDMTPPANPTSVTEIHTSSTVDLSWGNPTDSDFSKIRVYRDNVLLNQLSGTTYTDSTVSSNTSYVYKIVAIDTVGNESSGVTLTVKTSAEVGDQLLSPEDGWQRIDERDPKILYLGSGWTMGTDVTNHASTYSFSSSNGSYYKFKFRGTKLRILTNTRNTYSSNVQVNIDGTDVSTHSTSLAQNYKILVFERTGLSDADHVVEIKNLTSDALFADAIDIDSSGSLLDFDTTPPADVTSLTETHDAVSSTLTWVSPSDADFDKVKVYRDNVYVGESLTNSYEDAGLTVDTTYVYKVTTVDENGNESAGTTISVTTEDIVPPSNVTVLTATPSDTTVSLSWVNPPEVDFDEVIIYKGSTEIGRTTISPFVVGSLEPSTSYTFSVVSSDMKSNQSTGSTVITTTTNTNPPANVTGLSSTHTVSSVTLMWTNPTDSDFEEVVIYRDGVEIARTSSPPYTDSGLVTGTLYTYNVTSSDTVGNESSGVSISETPSQWATELTFDFDPTSAGWVYVGDPSTKSLSGGYVTITTANIDNGYGYYRKPSGLSNGDSATLELDVSVTDVSNGLPPSISMGDNVQNIVVALYPDKVQLTNESMDTVYETLTKDLTTSTKIRIIKEGTSYSVYVADTLWVLNYTAPSGSSADLIFGHVGSYSQAESVWNSISYANEAILPDSILPSIPTNFVVASKTDTTATLTWSTANAATGYTIKRNGATVYNGSALTFTDSGLLPSTSYSYTITATNVNGSSDSVTVTTTTEAPTASSEISGLSALKGLTSIRFTWLNPSDLRFSHVNIYKDGVFQSMTTSNSYTASGLSADTDYEFIFKTESNSGIESDGVSSTERISTVINPVGTPANTIVIKSSTSAKKEKLDPEELPLVYRNGDLANYLNQ